MLTGCTSYHAVAQFGQDKGFALAGALGRTMNNCFGKALTLLGLPQLQ